MGSLRLQQPQRTVNPRIILVESNFNQEHKMSPTQQSYGWSNSQSTSSQSSQSGDWNSSSNNKQLPGFGQTFNGGNNNMFSNNSSGNKKIDIGAEVDNVMKEQISKHNWNAFFNEFKK